MAIEGASLPSINDLLRAYGKLDVVKGTFSVYSEIKVQNGRIDGYVKPLSRTSTSTARSRTRRSRS